jgi:hypothetical protein
MAVRWVSSALRYEVDGDADDYHGEDDGDDTEVMRADCHRDCHRWPFPFFGRMSDRTASRLGMRRPWMVTGLAGGSVGIGIVALAPSIPVVLLGWCIAQLFFNALLAAMVAVLPDQIPSVQRGLVSGVLGVCLPIATACCTWSPDSAPSSERSPSCP